MRDEIASVYDEIRATSRTLHSSYASPARRADGGGTAFSGKWRNRQIQGTSHPDRRDDDRNIAVDHHTG
jgi:hypothetical protein